MSDIKFEGHNGWERDEVLLLPCLFHTRPFRKWNVQIRRMVAQTYTSEEIRNASSSLYSILGHGGRLTGSVAVAVALEVEWTMKQ